MVRTITSREFNQDVSGAKRLAGAGPVVITDRGKPAYVLMTHEAYSRLIRTDPSILELLADPRGEEIEFEPRRLAGGRIRKVDLG
jgi:PHD/YefM family antitoxin component YafN of YafNO toxin-antitoxin module